VFEHIFSDNGFTGVESGITDNYGRKTGLIIPYWEAKLHFHGLEYAVREKRAVLLLKGYSKK